MAINWNAMKETSGVRKHTSDPTVADVIDNFSYIWINTVSNSAWLLRDGTVTSLPITSGVSVPVTETVLSDLSDLQAEIDALQSEVDDLENIVGPEPETVEKTISGGGAITVAEGEKHILLIGDGGPLIP